MWSTRTARSTPTRGTTEMSDDVTISRKRLEDLERSERELNALNAFGVDNWEPYGDAMRSVDEDQD